MVENTPYGKRHISRTEPVYGKHNILDYSLHSPQSLLYTCQLSSMHSSTRKTPQKKTPKISPRHLLVNLTNVRVLAPPMLLSIGIWRQWQPLMLFKPLTESPAVRKARAPQRSYTGYRGCRITKIQEQFYGMQTQGVLLSDLHVVQKRLG